MRIVYLHQYFASPKKSTRQVTGTRSYEFAKRFAAAGHDVHMVCSDWTEEVVNSRAAWREETDAGIQIHALSLPYSNKMGFTERLGVFARFAYHCSIKASRLRGDVIFATSTPLTIAIPAILASLGTRIPMVFEVRDLWPEAPRQMGVLSNPLLYWPARALEISAYRAARHVVALSPGMAEGIISAGVFPQCVSMIPNASDLELFHPKVDGSLVRQRLSIGDRLAFIYFGTMGPANGLDFVLDAARELKCREELRAVFVLHGDGKMRRHLENRKAAEQLDNVIFSEPFGDKGEAAKIAAAADICMTIYKNIPVLYTCSPNKLFDSLAAGKPVLTNMPGWLGGLVEQNSCGIFVQPDSSIDFADKVQHLIESRAELPQMGLNARNLAEREFARDKQADKLLCILEQAVKDGPKF